MRQKIQTLIESDFNANEVATQTGIPVNTVYRIFNSEAKLDNITLKNAEKLADFWDRHKLRDYGYVHELVTAAVMDDESGVYEKACEWLDLQDSDQVIAILAEQYHQAACGVDDFDMPIYDYAEACIERDEE